jgi:tryptophan synthase alpha subunit
VADASVVGSAFVKLIANSKNDSALTEVRKLAQEMRKAIF